MGAALGSKLQGNDRVAVCFFGDGASNEGSFHESMNLASIWKLPVIFLCENNQYAVTSNFKDMVATENISDRAVAYNVPGVLVDGQDVIAMYEAVSQAVARARADQGPCLIEGKTYRYEGHSLGLSRILRGGDPRDAEELEHWKSRDPIDIHKKQLLSQGIATQEEIDQMDDEVEEADRRCAGVRPAESLPRPCGVIRGHVRQPHPSRVAGSPDPLTTPCP